MSTHLKNYYWTREQLARLATMRAEGFGFEAIALAIGRTPAACMNKAHVAQQLKTKDDYSRPRAGAAMTRACLRCVKSFKSEGPHNRLCKDCRKVSVSPLAMPATVMR